jgi:CHAT domain-containing protein/tetratricopeptide (TPR) repeat protein
VRAVAAFVLLTLAAAGAAVAQNGPRETAEQARAIDEVIRRCVAAGGLSGAEGGAGKAGLAVADPSRLKAAVTAERARLTPELRVGLIVRCQRVATASGPDAPALVALLRAVGEVSGDALTLGYAATFEGDRERHRPNPPAALRAYGEAARHFAAGMPGSEAETYRSIALVYAGQCDHRNELAYLERAVDLLRRTAGPRSPDLAAALEGLGITLGMRGQPGRAAATFREALQIYSAAYGENSPRVAATLSQLAAVQARAGDVAAAEASLRRALDIRRALSGDRSAPFADGLMALGRLKAGRGDLAGALDLSTRALEILKAAGGPGPGVADALREVALLYRRAGEESKAVAEYDQALAILRAAFGPQHRDVVATLGERADARAALGDTAGALDDYRACLDAQRVRSGDRGTDAAVTNVLVGRVYLERGEPVRALESFGKGLDVLRTIPGYEPSVVNVLSLMATADRQRGDPRRALGRLDEALAVARGLGPPGRALLADVLGNAADVELDLGAPGPAVARAKEALAVTEADGGMRGPGYGRALLALGRAQKAQGDSAAAVATFRQAADALREAPGPTSPDFAIALLMLGRVHFDRGELAEAYDALKRSLDARLASQGERHPNTVSTLKSLAVCEGRRGRLAEALAYSDRALAALRVDPRAAGPPRAAADLRPVQLTVEVLTDRGTLLQNALEGAPASRLRECVEAYRMAADVLDEVRTRVVETPESKLAAGEGAFDLFPRLAALSVRLAEQDRDLAARAEAFTAADRAAARVFLEALGRARAWDVGRVDPALRAREEDLGRIIERVDDQVAREQSQPVDRRDPERVARLLAERERRKVEREEVRRGIERDYPDYAAWLSPRCCSVDQARACLADDEVALLYVPGTDASSLVVVAKRPDPETAGVAVYRMPPVGELAELVAALTRPGALDDPGAARALGAEAYRALLAPAAKAIEGKAVVIVPGGPLGLLPFELTVEPGGREGGRYLIEGHRVRYAPSLTTLHLVRLWERRRTAPERPLWAVGDPVFRPDDPRLAAAPAAGPSGSLAEAVRLRGDGASGFDRLPASGDEVRRIARLLGASTDDLLVGPSARESEVKRLSESGALTRYRFIHLATHGVLDPGDGGQPALILSLVGDGGGSDGLLRLGEVSGLRLNADLVVLSACQTGRGRTDNAEGVTGLARAFLHAGSRGVVCSLWRVDDAATADLMADLYAGLKGGRPAADALREARLRRIAAGEPPLHWAPFVLIGE